MLASRRLIDTDDRGDVSEDYVGGEVVMMPRRRTARVAGKRVVERVEWSGKDRRDITTRAILTLRSGGFKIDEIAVAVGLTDRQVYNKLRMVREVAEAPRHA